MATTEPTEGARSRHQEDVLVPMFRSDQSDTPSQWTVWDAIKAFSLRNFVLALILATLGAAGGAAIALKQPKVYSSTATVMIDQPKAIAQSADAGLVIKLAVLKVKYADLANTPAIAGPAAQSLGLSEQRVAGAVLANAPQQNLLITVAAQDASPSEARRIANAVSNSMANYASQEQIGIGVPPANQYQLTIVDPASSASKIRPTSKRALQGAVGLGVIFFGLAYVVMQLLTARVRLR